MSLENQPKEEMRVMFPEETKWFNIYKKIRESIKKIEAEFEDEY